MLLLSTALVLIVLQARMYNGREEDYPIRPDIFSCCMYNVLRVFLLQTQRLLLHCFFAEWTRKGIHATILMYYTTVLLPMVPEVRYYWLREQLPVVVLPFLVNGLSSMIRRDKNRADSREGVESRY